MNKVKIIFNNLPNITLKDITDETIKKWIEEGIVVYEEITIIKKKSVMRIIPFSQIKEMSVFKQEKG